MADLTRVAEVLAAHHAWSEDGGGFDGCACGNFEPPAGWFGGYEAHAAHQAQMLAAAGLVASETEWGCRDPESPDSLIVCDTEAEARHIAGPYVHDPSVWDVVRREVTPWVAAQPAQEGHQTPENGAGVGKETGAAGTTSVEGM